VVRGATFIIISGIVSYGIGNLGARLALSRNHLSVASEQEKQGKEFHILTFAPATNAPGKLHSAKHCASLSLYAMRQLGPPALASARRPSG
jgi:hypothetical protein